MTEQLMLIVATVLVSNVLQAFLTVQGVKVHIQYLREGVRSAHDRIDRITGQKSDCNL